MPTAKLGGPKLSESAVDDPILVVVRRTFEMSAFVGERRMESDGTGDFWAVGQPL